MVPFDLPGPQFLVFYGVFALAVILALNLGRRLYETGPMPQIEATDPYLFACLRGGPNEVARVATLALVDRGLLQIGGGKVRWTSLAQIEPGQPRIVQAVLRHFEHNADLASVMTDQTVRAVAVADYEDELRRQRLLPDTEIRETRRTLILVAAACLIAVGGVKLAIALAAGRRNVMFLIVMMVVALVIVWKSGNPYRARLGEDYLGSIRAMFANLRQRAKSIQPGSGSREVLWLTALFGVAALPSAAFPFVRDFRPKSDGGSGCGSGCGSGGGGGCGGGGGGCGGCGS
jgi:uncharacterized protein (TIGR04222 family)